MQKIRGEKKHPKFELIFENKALRGIVHPDGEFLKFAIDDFDMGHSSFTLTSLHDVALLRDFVRRSERLMKDSVKIQK